MLSVAYLRYAEDGEEHSVKRK